ncbi:MAG TPA: hypothetical protein VMU55_04170, partial [Solirubrobacteraceae bacterium]|nr:hypothetical protein [Solirubrobacteraceae bacterium]
MRTYATMHPTKDAKQPSDTCNTILLAAGVGQAMDWPAGTSIARLTGQSTAGAAYNFYANLQST